MELAFSGFHGHCLMLSDFGAYGLVQGVAHVPALSAAWVQSAALNLPLQAEVLLEQLVSTEVSVPQLLQALANLKLNLNKKEHSKNKRRENFHRKKINKRTMTDRYYICHNSI